MSPPVPLQPSAPDLAARHAALEARRDLLALAWLPWAIGVFLPVLLASTVSMGALAVLVALVSPDAAWWLGVAWCRLLCLVNLTRVELRGVEHVPDRPCVYMLNHQSHFDVACFYGRWRHQFRWVMKEELRRVPGVGWYGTIGGHVFIDRSNRDAAIASLDAAARRMADKDFSVAFFPEGTRSRDGRLQRFKKGGFVMARQLGLPVLPISISGTHAVLPGKRLRLLPGRVTVTVHPPIDSSRYDDDQLDQLMADTRAAIASGLTPWERGEAS